MPRSLAAVLALVLASLLALAPTVFPDAAPADWNRLHLGHRLQGGVQIDLDIDWMVAARREVELDARHLEWLGPRHGVEGIDARVGRLGALEIRSTAPHDAIRRLVHRGIGTYVSEGHDGDLHRFELSPQRLEQIRVEQLGLAQRELLARVQCHVPAATAEPLGRDHVRLSLPGEVDLQSVNCR